MAKVIEEIVIKVRIKPGLSMFDAIKMRICGNSEVFWAALAKKISEEKDDNPRINPPPRYP